MIYKLSTIILCLTFLASCQIKKEEVTELPIEKKEEKQLELPMEKEEHLIEYSSQLYNYTGNIIDEIYVVKGEEKILLASEVEDGENFQGNWAFFEKNLVTEYGYIDWGSPYFLLVIDGEEIPITVAKINTPEDFARPRQELYITNEKNNNDADTPEGGIITSEEIVFFYEHGEYFLSRQLDYLTNNDKEKANYVYLPKVERWLLQKNGQLLFAVGMTDEKILEHFPDYHQKLPMYQKAVLLSTDTIYLEDFSIEQDEEDYTKYYEIKLSDNKKAFTPNDIMIIEVDHVMDFRYYYRYRDSSGNLQRYFVTDGFVDYNNKGIYINEIPYDSDYFNLILAE